MQAESWEDLPDGALPSSPACFAVTSRGSLPQQLTLTIQSSLTFNSGSTYTYTFKAKGSKSKIDKVIANGVTINSGTTFNRSARPRAPRLKAHP